MLPLHYYARILIQKLSLYGKDKETLQFCFTSWMCMYLYNGNFVMEEVTGGWRRLQNKELYNLHSTDIIND
jgi:hypothetical protein